MKNGDGLEEGRQTGLELGWWELICISTMNKMFIV
jgi:hypothetical protein